MLTWANPLHEPRVVSVLQNMEKQQLHGLILCPRQGKGNNMSDFKKDFEKTDEQITVTSLAVSSLVIVDLAVPDLASAAAAAGSGARADHGSVTACCCCCCCPCCCCAATVIEPEVK